MNPSAPPIALFAPASSKRFGTAVAAALGLELSPSEEREFEGGEHKMRPLCEVRNKRVFVIQSLCGDDSHTANDKLCRLLFFIGALKDAGAPHVTACVPYMSYARKDRRTKSRDPVITKYIARMFESVDTDRVIVLDVHNESAIDNAFRIESIRIDAAALFARELTDHIGTDLLVASPDAGGMKRAHQFRSFLQEQFEQPIGVGFMEKIRSSGQLSGETFVGDARGRDVIIFDDMIVSGSTLMRAVLAARRAGARRVLAVATHAPFTRQAMQLFAAEGPDQLWITDSVPLPEAFSAVTEGRIKICSAAPLFAMAMNEILDR